MAAPGSVREKVQAFEGGPAAAPVARENRRPTLRQLWHQSGEIMTGFFHRIIGGRDNSGLDERIPPRQRVWTLSSYFHREARDGRGPSYASLEEKAVKAAFYLRDGRIYSRPEGAWQKAVATIDIVSRVIGGHLVYNLGSMLSLGIYKVGKLPSGFQFYGFGGVLEGVSLVAGYTAYTTTFVALAALAPIFGVVGGVLYTANKVWRWFRQSDLLERHEAQIAALAARVGAFEERSARGGGALVVGDDGTIARQCDAYQTAGPHEAARASAAAAAAEEAPAEEVSTPDV